MPSLTPITEDSRTATPLAEFAPGLPLYPSLATYPSASGTYPSVGSGLRLTPLPEA